MNKNNRENPSMTALMSCFVKAYHHENSFIKVYDDFLSKKLLSADEYYRIAQSLKDGIAFFNPAFDGTPDDALEYIVNTHLGPSVLGRSAFTEKSLETAAKLGVNQYLIFASGYDTSGCKFPDMQVFELDKSQMITDKIRRLEGCNISTSNVSYVKSDFTNSLWKDALEISGYDGHLRAFCSLLGISYYLSAEEFIHFIEDVSSVLATGSTIVFDYPVENGSFSENLKEKMAKGADEEMLSKYSYGDIEKMLENADMLIYEHLEASDIEHQYFATYNSCSRRYPLVAPKDVSYCLAVKR